MSAEMQPLAVVTGASSGLGREFAKIAAVRGYRLLLIARNLHALEALSGSLRTESHLLPLDLTAPGAADQITGWLADRGIVPEVFINNAGFGAFGPAVEMDEARVKKMIRLNVTALTTLSLRMLRHMKAAGRGRIMNVASTAAFQPCPYLGVYGATKAYVLSLTEALAEEAKGSGVTVTALCPGPTRTNFGVNAGLKEDSPFDRYAADADKVALFGFNAMEAGKVVAVHGGLNRLGAFATRLVPRGAVRRIAASLIGRMK
jgi:short-subunit dehydrogenase